MADIAFYHLETQGLEVAMPKLLERVISSGLKASVRIANPELLDSLNKALWSYDPLSFLPHGSKKSGNPERQPIYLSSETENQNGATVLLLVNDAENDGFEDYERCLLMFEGIHIFEKAICATVFDIGAGFAGLVNQPVSS